MNRFVVRVLVIVWLALAASARADDSRPAALRDVGIDQHLDQRLPLDLSFRDEDGKVVRIGDFFGAKPVILIFAYYHCPMLCPLALEGMVRSLRPLALGAGKEFDVVTVSIDARETPAQAAQSKKKLLSQYGRQDAASGWHALVGDAESLRSLTEAAGFHYRYEAESDQFAHATALVVLTPQGRISRYLYGIDYAPRDVKLALVEASAGKIGTLADQLLLFCYHYDPATGKYGPAAMTAVRVAGALTVMILGGFIAFQIRHEERGA